jgi:hypothetical protein
MTTLQIVAGLAGLAVLSAPAVPGIVDWFLARPPKPAPSYEDAILRLADVRHRLNATDALGDDQRKAIDVLTLALVDGSDL